MTDDLFKKRLQADVLETIDREIAALTPSSHDATSAVLKLLAENEHWIDPSRMSSFARSIRQATGITMEWIRGGIKNHKRARREASRLIVTETGKPLPLEANAILLLRSTEELQGLFALDEFRQQSVVTRQAPWEGEPAERYPRDSTDADLAELLAWMHQRGVYLRGVGGVKTALVTVVNDAKFHPIRDYLSSLQWDGVPRLASGLHEYLGVQPIPGYTDRIFLKWMVSAVARVMRPGCMAKYVLHLEGPQDLGKSYAAQILGGRWFTDDMSQLGTKDSSIQVGNAWIIELPELDSMSRADASSIKAFISRNVDRFRPPYGTHVVHQARQSVMITTHNPSGKTFKDETGAVRFWPVACTRVDKEALQRDRDQLWAEAAVLYATGERWWFAEGEEESIQIALDQQAERSELVEDHPWTEVLRDWVAEREREVNLEVARYRGPDGIPDWGDVSDLDLGDVRCRVRRSDGTLVLRLDEVLEGLGVDRQHMNQQAVWRQATKILMALGWKTGTVDRACCPAGKKERVRRWQRIIQLCVTREPGEDEEDGLPPWDE